MCIRDSSNTTKAELRKSLSELFASKDEVRPGSLQQLIQSNIPTELIMEVLMISDVEFILKENYVLYKKLTLEIIDHIIKHQHSLASASAMSICIELLQRMLVPLFPASELYMTLLWESNSNAEVKSAEESLFKTEENKNEVAKEEVKGEVSVKAPIGMQLTQALVNILFLPDYSIAKLGEQDGGSLDGHGIESRAVWSSGINCKSSKQTKVRQFDANRSRVLSLLLTCIGSSIYHAPNTVPNYFSICVVNSGLRNLKNLFYSLINTVLGYNWRGLGIPYLSARSNRHEELIGLALQVLYGLIEYVPLSLDKAEELVEKDGVVRNIACLLYTSDAADE
eukprot:TRINITY_DN17259_c0_g1_i7.p1 TRINITY_DN17259_c0_g1~~TRINITY_DN17259_c0_g1_i7.p1  ORF type:complete len:354 (-),score=72.60 TRINITY_DN17259_c0_g1_i7:28-1041(-)